MPASDFIARLRQKVGHDLLFVPAVAVVARNHAQELLLVQDRETKLWGCPGGSIEPTELPSDAAVRETWEESGVFVELDRVLGVFGGEQCGGTYANGDRVAWVATVFAAHVLEGDPSPDGVETSAARFFSAAQLRALPLSNHTRMYLAAERAQTKGTYFAPSAWRPSAA
jgi:ADP-ribose pyrophosphatase YjhB (NUDIX family)